jgi:hypothetical protein
MLNIQAQRQRYRLGNALGNSKVDALRRRRPRECNLHVLTRRADDANFSGYYPQQTAERHRCEPA